MMKERMFSISGMLDIYGLEFEVDRGWCGLLVDCRNVFGGN